MSIEKEVFKINYLDIQKKVNNNPVKLIKNASLQLNEDEILAIVGERQSGKTLLISSVYHLFEQKKNYVNGDFYLKEVHLNKLEKNEFKSLVENEIGYIPEKIADLFTFGKPWYKQLLAEAKKQGIVDAKNNLAKLFKKIKLPNIEEIKDQRLKDLTLESQKKIALGLIFILKPSLLLLDEITTGLDVIAQLEVLDLIYLYKEETNAAVIMTTGDWRMAAEGADKVAILKEGEIIEENTTQAIYTQPSYPYTKQLFETTQVNLIGSALMNNEVQLILKNINIDYTHRSGFLFLSQEKTEIIEDFSFTFEKGKSYGLIGKNGVGKSLLARGISGDKKITSGEITINEQLPKNKDIVYISKDKVKSLKEKTAILKQFNKNSEIDHEILLELIGFKNKDLNQQVNELTYEEKIKLVLALNLQNNPSFIILDDIASCADFSQHHKIWDSVKRLQSELSFGLIIITQEIDQLKDLTEYILIMDRGCLVEIGEVNKIKTKPQHIYTKRLLASIPQLDPRVRHVHKAVRQRVESEYYREYSNFYDYEGRAFSLQKFDDEHWVAFKPENIS